MPRLPTAIVHGTHVQQLWTLRIGLHLPLIMVDAGFVYLTLVFNIPKTVDRKP
ncbi:hypothetical protein [Sulfobacillus thermosulfidooxidans]|uniref:hypothetical protein n=1 Tax=Sulfobacillus thermosulfidooxidans TaxID=28034 RepID=UPI001493E39B|nr:hypothetical protein [Sulfobacillus thermosulfidooxidans]